MKRLILGLAVVLLLVSLSVGQLADSRVTPMMISSPQSRWTELGTITASDTYPTAGNRDYTTVSALDGTKTFVWNLPNWARNAQLCFQTNADADSTTIVLMGFADNKMVALDASISLDDDAIYLGQLVLTGGTQVGSHTNVYVDTVVATDGACGFNVQDSANNRRCVVEFKSKGYKYIVGIATTLQASSTLYALGRFY